MMSQFKKIAVVSWVVMFASCVTLFNVVGKKEDIRGNKLAVISGLNKTETNLYVHYMTDELARVSKFKVMSQQEIKSRLGVYPVNIKGPYTSAYTSINEKYDNTDMAKLGEIQRKLGVDNLFVVWAPIHVEIQISGSTGTPYEIHTIAQLFAYPGGKEIGRNMLKATYASGFVIGPGVPRSPEGALKQVGEAVAKKVAEQTGMLK